MSGGSVTAKFLGWPVGLLGLTFAANIVYRLNMENRGERVRFRAIVERAADGIVTMNHEGSIELVNKAAESMFGYREPELLTHDISVLFSSTYADVEDASLLEFLARNALQASGMAQEVIGLRRNGESFFMDLSISQAEIGDHDIYVAILRDVTDRKKAEITLNKAHRELEKRVEERTIDLRNSNVQLENEIVVRKEAEANKDNLIKELQEARTELSVLSGMIPICASCKKVRDDDGFWNQIESYIAKRSEAEFSHGICPDCREQLYPELLD